MMLRSGKTSGFGLGEASWLPQDGRSTSLSVSAYSISQTSSTSLSSYLTLFTSFILRPAFLCVFLSTADHMPSITSPSPLSHPHCVFTLSGSCTSSTERSLPSSCRGHSKISSSTMTTKRCVPSASRSSILGTSTFDRVHVATRCGSRSSFRHQSYTDRTSRSASSATTTCATT